MRAERKPRRGFVFPDERARNLMRGIADFSRAEWRERFSVFSGNKLQLQTDLVSFLEREAPGKQLGNKWPHEPAVDNVLRRLKTECSDLSRYFHRGGIDLAGENHSFRTLILMTDTLYSLRTGGLRVSEESPFHNLVGAKISVGKWAGNFELAYLKLDNEIDGIISQKRGKEFHEARNAQDVKINYAEIEAEAAEKVFGPDALKEYKHWKKYYPTKNFFRFIEERAGG
jgi:hypothetical protein